MPTFKRIQTIAISAIQAVYPNVLGIYLFGSRAAQQETTGSDIDLALLLPSPAEPVALWNCAQTIAQQLQTDVDLVDLRTASTVFRAQIIQEGRRIFTSDPTACDLFETFAIASYLRFNEERREILDAIQRDKHVLHLENRGQAHG